MTICEVGGETKIEEDQAGGRIGEKKQQTAVDDLCAGFPEESAECLRCVRGLGFEDRPDYNHLQDLLSRVLENAGEADDGGFDWTKAGEERLRGLEIRPPPGPTGVNAAPPLVVAEK